MASSSMITAGWILILAYMALTLVFVVRGARRNRDLSDYALGSLAFSPVAVGLALAASMTSAATFIINPGFVALYGLSAVISYAVVLPAASMVSLVVLTKGFRKHGTNVKALSMSQWMGTRWGSDRFGLFFAFLSLLLVTFIVLIVVGLTKVLAGTLGISETVALIGVVLFIFGYMMFGGANSMVYTNTVQALLMLVVAFILLGSGHEHFSAGVHGFLDKLRAVDPALTGVYNTGSFLFRDFFEIVVAQIVVGVAIVCQPHIITKSLLLKTDRDVNRYLAVGVTVETLFFFVVFAGLFARLAFPDLAVGGEALKMDGIIPAYVLHEFPVAVGLLVVMGLLSAGISTLEGLIQSLATTITADIVSPLGARWLPAEGEGRDRTLLKFNRLAICLLAIAALLLSRDQLLHPKLSVAIFAQNGVYAYFSAAFVPILFGMFWKDAPHASAITASVTALVVHFSMYYGKLPVPGTLATGENPGVAAAVAILVSLVVAALVALAVGRRRDAVS